MVDTNVGEERLALYDGLNGDEKEKRRLQVLCLWDFYSETICKVGTTYLGLSRDMKDINLNMQWTRARNRLNALAEFSSEKKYEIAISDLKKLRDNSFHDYEYWPPKGDLATIRGEAEDFRSWVLEFGEQYDESINELDARDTMIRIAERNLQQILDAREPHEEPFSSEVQNEKKRARKLKAELDALNAQDEVSMELVNILMSSMEHQEQAIEAVEGGEYVGWVLGEIAEPKASPDEFGL